MADHNPQHGRRQHFHRGRRGPDRRGTERGTERRTQSREHAQEAGPRETRENGGVDVEQIMREIRARIAQRHGIELNNQQIQELAARRLDAILEPRNIKPQLLEQLRRSAGAAPELPASAPHETYAFEDTTLYDTHRGILRFFRRLLNPILKLFFNPTPLINALNTQVRINKDLAARELERERRQSEWNALQYELVQRVVLETSRISIELQALSARIESLSTKVDFNDRKVRALENTPAALSSRPAPRHMEPTAAPAAQPEAPSPEAAASGEGTGESRRRRRRRRGRRGGSGPGELAGGANAVTAVEDEIDAGDLADTDEDEPGTGDTGGITAVETTTLPAVVSVTEALPAVVSSPPDTRPPLASADAPAPSETPAPPVAEVQEPPAPVLAGTPEPPMPTPLRVEPRPGNPVVHANPGPEDR